MKRRIFSFIILFTITTGVFSVQATPSVEQGKMVQALNDARMVSIAMGAYALDKVVTQGRTEYPKTLNELVEGNYLTEGDLERVTTLNQYILPLGNLPVTENTKVAFLIAIYRGMVIVYYSDKSTETFQADE